MNRLPALFVLLSLLIIHVALLAQPQPHVKVDPDIWVLLEYANGSQWYVRRSAVQALHAVPVKDQEALGHKTVIHLTGGTRIQTPYLAKELQEKMGFGNVPDLVDEER